MGHPACVLDVRRRLPFGPRFPQGRCECSEYLVGPNGRGYRLAACWVSKALQTMDAAGESVTQQHAYT